MNQDPWSKKPDRKAQPDPRGLGRLPRFSWLWVLVIGFVLFWLWGQFARGLGPNARIDYSTFLDQVKSGNVEQVVISGEQIRGRLKSPLSAPTDRFTGSSTFVEFTTYMPAFGDDRLLPLLEQQGVRIQAQPKSNFSFWTVLLSLLPVLVMVGLAYLFLSRMRVQGEDVLSMGKSRAKRFDRRRERTTFSDVAGAHGAKIELQEIIEFLKDPTRFHRLGAETPKGVLLVGPPGTGKTLLARAVAGEAGVPFFSITGSDFMEMFVGVGASRVRDMFAEAKKAAPSIIFIDELDSVGRRRSVGIGSGGGHDEREQTLNQLLSELDGFEPNENVIVMAATNRVDILDPALLRPGRFDRHINVDLPTMRDRAEILQVHARNKPIEPGVDLNEVARGTPGFSGADLENLLNEAALLAARKNQDSITQKDIESARDKIMMGMERENLSLTRDDLRLIAYHEAGHALAAALLPHTDPLHKVTIVPRGRAMGVTQQLPEREKYIYGRDYMLDRLAVMMGGRAAEDLVFGMPTSGAENDLKEATRLARRMVLDWGMSKYLKHVAFGESETYEGLSVREYSDVTAREIDEEIRQILDEAYERTLALLREHRQSLNRIVDALLEKEDVPGEEVMVLIQETEGLAVPKRAEEPIGETLVAAAQPTETS